MVRYQGASGMIPPDNRTSKFLKELWKEWGETWMCEKIEGL